MHIFIQMSEVLLEKFVSGLLERMILLWIKVHNSYILVLKVADM